jgi:uncharacterized membrane protein YhaH (DUF805 family)
MDLRWLLTGRDGRIGRKSFWIGVLILALVGIVLNFLVAAAFGGGLLFEGWAEIATGNFDPEAVSAMLIAGTRQAAWGSLVVYLLLAYPFYALMVKRRHDRNSPGLDALVFMGLTVLVLLAQALGFGYALVEVPFPPPDGPAVTVPAPTPALMALNTALGIFSIYLIVVLGFLKGTVGENSYGPDPLAG